MMAPPALMVLGPTAGGKTALALAFAEETPCEVISIDSALVYRGMDIGTAKPSPAEMAIAPHHLIDVREIDEPYSVADFVADCSRLVPEIRARGRAPLVVGGTMLYANALLKGLSNLPQTPAGLRSEVAAEAAEAGWPEMRRRLALVDPETASRLSPNDSQRIGRALEVYRLTGRPMSEVLRDREGVPPPMKCLAAALVPKDRAALHRRIEERFDAMLEAGFLDEVKSLMASPRFDPAFPAMRSVGYRQAVAYLSGGTDFDSFRLAAIAATRQLAKRQMTWLRSMPGVAVFDPFEEEGREAALNFLREGAASL